ncbi:MAG: sodium-dependent bicarbonate transport family permease [Rhodanobacteraceae bacterium]|nr:sodium-dependent bicarbonate transport family permease [Rhodanobacteraceae bacterium]
MLAFVLGFSSQAAGGNLRLAEPARETIATFLLLAIGLKGGEALARAELGMLAIPLGATVLAGVVTCVSAFFIARLVLKSKRPDAAALAAHYGSASAVTFIAATHFVADRGMPSDGWLSASLAVLEMPAILLAVLLARGVSARLADTVREVFLARASVLLLGGLLIGFVSGPSGVEPVMPLFKGLFHGVLMLYLLDLGAMAADGFASFRNRMGRIIAFGVGVPLLHGVLATLAAVALGFSAANAAVFATLVASASYIAAPAAMRTSVPESNVPLCITAAITITFPFNLLVGIPLFYMIATAI